MKNINETITEAKSLLEYVQKRRQNSPSYSSEAITQKTINEYNKVFARLEKLTKNQMNSNFAGGQYTPYDFIRVARNVKTKVTWFKRKAAIFYCLNHRVLSQLALTSDSINQACLEQDVKIIDLLESLKPPYAESSNNQTKSKLVKKSGLNSKRNLLKNLPDDWREQIFDKTNFRGGREEQLLSLAITGCRPVELQKGIFWELNEQGLTATIIGAKRKKYSGQLFRKLIFSINYPLVNRMANIVAEVGGKLSVQINNRDDISEYIRELGAFYFPTLKSKLTAYVFRHQFAADLKSILNSDKTTLTLNDLAGALGHSTDEMQRHYGHYKQSKGGDAGLVKVQVERAVIKKIKSSFKPNNKLKPT